MKKIKTSSLHEAQKQTLESALLFLSEKAAKKTMKMEKKMGMISFQKILSA